MRTINLIHLYPKEMNIYGDNGNLLVLKRRLEWRNIPVKVTRVGIGDEFPEDTHLVIGGGGQDAGQSVIARDLQKKSSSLHKLADNKVPMLMICGMYQMFGHYFKTQANEEIPGIGLLDLYTVAESGRLIGNIIIQTKWGEIIGYENHSGRTFLGSNAGQFGGTKKNQGNNGTDETEGAVYKNVFGSYLHGPLLAKSSGFADYMLKQAINCSGGSTNLITLDNTIEDRAAETAKKRPR